MAAAPWLESWDEADIEAYANVLDSAERHLAGKCDSRGFIVDGVLLPECHFLMPARESGKFEAGRCPRRAQAEFELALKRSGLPRRHLRGLDELEPNAAVQQVKEWVSAYEPGCRGLLLAGKVGTGKTQLVTAAGFELLRHDKARPAVGGAPQVFYTTAHAFLAALKDFDGTAKEVRQKAHGAGVLILDDLGAEGATDWSRGELQELLDVRYREMRTIIVTTNLSKRDLETHIGERAVSRLAEMCDLLVISGPDRRRQRKEGGTK